ncbi:MAG: hypothetical protein M3Y27_13850 [Acidobacteriota bacterium]|nr:hypothetical protein [Acidobacteriota bacterium]
MGHGTFSILGIRVDIHDVRRGRIGSFTADLLIGIDDVNRLNVGRRGWSGDRRRDKLSARIASYESGY